MNAVVTETDASPTTRDAERILTWRWPWLYEALFRLSPTSRLLRAREIDAVLTRIDELRRPGEVVVEVGCGPGTYTRHLAARFDRVLAVDASRGMVDHTIARMQREGHVNVVGACGVLPDALGVPADADGVVAIGVLDFAEDLTRWLRALRGCATPDGWVVFTVPHARPTPRLAGIAEGVLAGRVFTRRMDQVQEAAADAGLRRVRIAVVEHRGRAFTLVGSAMAS